MMYTTIYTHLTLLVLFLTTTISAAQDPGRFKDEIERLQQVEYAFDETEDVIVFAGSSSIRMWEDLKATFPDHQLVKSGFGGSQTSDLLYYADELILQYSPDKVFIYEGDNDLTAGKSPAEIMTTMLALIEKIEQANPDVEIVLIAAKPSPSRWSLKRKYEELNRRFEIFSSKKDNVAYADVWTAMLDDDGRPKGEIFLQDSLHMNSKGYDLWEKEMRKHLE